MNAAPFRIGYDPDFAPITFAAADGQAGGAAIRLLAGACADAGIDCRFVPVAQPRQHECLAAGEIDALAALGVTAARKAGFSFSPAYLTTGAGWFAPAPFDPDAAPPGTNVTTPASGPLVALIAARWPHLRVVAAADYADALGRASRGEVAAAALNVDVGRLMCRERFAGIFDLPAAPFLEIGLALGCLAGSHAGTLERLSAFLPPPRGLTP